MHISPSIGHWAYQAKTPFHYENNCFSEESAAQYKNYKNSSNLSHHETDFSIRAEWGFFVTLHGKNEYDGVSCTIKRFAAHESLQKPITDQISNPIHLFAKNEITG